VGFRGDRPRISAMNPFAMNGAQNCPVILEGRKKRMSEVTMAAIESQAWPNWPIWSRRFA